MWLFKDVVILMNFFEPCIVKYLSYTLIWRKSLVESCWKGAHSFNSVIEVFALAIATGFRALVKVFAIAILIGHAILSFFLPIRSTLAFWQPWLQTGYLLNTFLLFLVVWNIWSFLGKRRQNIFVGFFLLVERASFCDFFLFDLSCLSDYFQLDTQY